MAEAAAALGCVLLAVAWSFGAVAVAGAAVLAIGMLVAVVRTRPPADGDPDDTPGSGIAVLTLAVLGGGLFVAWYVGDPSLVAVWVPAMVGAVVAAGEWMLAGRSGLVRHRVLAMATVLWGFTVTVTWGELGLDAMPILFWGLGAVLGAVAAWAVSRARS